jgi:hypothetical protein
MATDTVRSRMILELPTHVQMAIKLRAVKKGMTTGAVVCEAIQKVFESDIQEAKNALAESKPAKHAD